MASPTGNFEDSLNETLKKPHDEDEDDSSYVSSDESEESENTGGISKKRDKRLPLEAQKVTEYYDPVRTEPFFDSTHRLLGLNKKLKHNNLWQLRTSLKCSKVYTDFEQEWEKEIQKPKPSFLQVLLKVNKYQLLFAVFLFALYATMTFAPPVILPLMISYMLNYSLPWWYGLVFTLVVFLCSLLGSMAYYHSLFQAAMIGMKMRMTMMQAVYCKALKLPKSQGGPGQIINLFSSDCQMIYDGIMQLIPGVIAPFHLIGAIILLGFFINWYCLIPIATLAVFLPLTIYLGSLIGTQRREIQLSSDTRLKLTTELIQGIRIVKYYAWEKPFLTRIDDARKHEIQLLTQLGYYRTFLIFLISNASTLSLAFTLLFYGLFNDQEISAANAFTVISVMNVTRQPFAWASIAYLMWFYNITNINRVGEFLSVEEKKEYITYTNDPVGTVHIKKATFKWAPPVIPLQQPTTTQQDLQKDEDDNHTPLEESPTKKIKNTLRDIDLKIKPGQKVMIVGSVGSGKSSMSLALLGEIPLVSGSINISGDIAYVPQQAWIYNATVRDNILFGEKFDEDRYQKVLAATALVSDLSGFPAGDLTEIGDRGVNLSGGQRQRISIARAIYANKPINIFDDPLSAVDSHVSKHLFTRVIQEFLKKKTLVMATNQLQYLPYADKVVFLQNGKISGQGKFEDLKNENKKFAKLIEKYGVKNDEEGKDIVEQSSKDTVKEKKSQPKIIHQPPKESVADEQKRKEKGQLTKIEERQTGLIPMRIYWYYIQSGGIRVFIFCVVFFLISAALQVGGTWWLSVWSSVSANFASESASYNTIMDAGNFSREYMEENAGANVTVGNGTVIIPGRPTYDVVYWPLTYVAWLFGNALGSLVVTYFLNIYFSTTASLNLHATLISKVSNAATAFFDSTPVGRILTRLTQDLMQIDFVTSISFVNVANSFFTLLATLAGIGLGTWYIFLVILPVMSIYFSLQVYFRKTNIEIQRLEALSRAPPVSHLSATLSGLDTIRAFHRKVEFQGLSEKLIDYNNVEKYALRFANAWYGLRLDFLGACIVAFVYGGITITRNLFPGILSSASAGIAMSYMGGFVSLLSAFSVFTSDLEIRMNSVERFWEYNSIAQETTEFKQQKPELWPKKGAMEFVDFSFKYRSGPLILDNLNFVIAGNSKIGIVGRTGAGKSSLLQALYRIEEPLSGTVIIDKVDFRKLSLYELRSSLAIIPQDPTLFTGNLRYNMDPFNEYRDDEIWRALDMVKLKTTIVNHPKQLYQPIEENGANFSVGQRQLLCMARAVLKKTKILLLDEATASVDVETDAIIQNTIRQAFKFCTVLTIAHRLNTIMDSDKILVLDRGAVAEYDSPIHLLKNKNGIFYSMVQATGRSSAKHLMDIARGKVSVVKSVSALSPSDMESMVYYKQQAQSLQNLTSEVKELKDKVLSVGAALTELDSYSEQESDHSTGRKSSGRIGLELTSMKSDINELKGMMQVLMAAQGITYAPSTTTDSSTIKPNAKISAKTTTESPKNLRKQTESPKNVRKPTDTTTTTSTSTTDTTTTTTNTATTSTTTTTTTTESPKNLRKSTTDPTEKQQ